jgi:membrane carboxypeptidase/penicillin-binding protein
MENVHGIAVAGGSFPAEIWRLFMERAVRYSPQQDFSLPKTYPSWKPFERGRYAIQNAPETTTSTTTGTKTKAAKTAPEITTEQQIPVPLEPTTTVDTTEAPPPPPPPVTTTATTLPPPVTTTLPPPTEPPATTTVGDVPQ